MIPVSVCNNSLREKEKFLSLSMGAKEKHKLG